MKNHLILVAALLLCRNLLPAQNLSAYVTNGNNTTLNSFSYPCPGPFPPAGCKDKQDLVICEYPPWIIAGSWRTYYLTDGVSTNVASSPASMITTNDIDFRNNGGDPVKITEISGCSTQLSQDAQPEPWRLQYYSLYSAQYINHPTAGTVNLGFVEGENYTQIDRPGNGTITNCSSRDVNTTYLCGEWIPNNQSTNWGQQPFPNHMGPIIWPATGIFTNTGIKSSGGCANNSTIQADDGYLYVFYKDHSDGGIGALIGPGRQPGIKVARAPISDALNPHAYQTFYEDANGVHWNPSLPAGFNKNNIVSYYTSLGPQGTVLVEPTRDYTRFAVAKVAGTNYYMAVGNYIDPDPSHVTYDAVLGGYFPQQVVNLKYSYDLIHWFGDRTIYTAQNFRVSDLNYSIFLSSDGWSNTLINENEFYVIGTQPENPNATKFVYKIRVYIPQTPPAGLPVSCNSYLHVAADASGATIGDVDVTGKQLTVEALFNRTEDYSLAEAGGDLVSKHCNTTDANYFLRPKSAGITTTDGYFQVDLPCDLERDLTYHVAMVYDGSQLSIYRNGLLEASVPATGNLVTNNLQTTIGTGACGSNHFRGYINEVRVWRKVRTQAQLRQFYNLSIAHPINDADLLAYYGFYSYANQGSYPAGAVLFGNANGSQTNSNCTIDDVGCFGFARKVVPVTQPTPMTTLYPNPASDYATLLYSGSANGSIIIKVLDITGKTIKVIKKPVTKGNNAIQIDLTTLSNGVYSVQCIENDKILTKKLVISK